jgi:ubiquinone biosynthesis protein UbiJ
VLTEPPENLLNRNLSRSPAARKLCASLRGTTLGIHLEGLDQHVLLQSLGDSLKLSHRPVLETSTLEASTVDVFGSPINLLAMLMSDPQSANRQRLLTTKAVRIQGDIAVLEQYQKLLQRLQPELPAEIESLLGDTVVARTFAHRAGKWLQSLRGFGRHTVRTASMNWAEYLAHESGDLVPRAQAEQFLVEVDDLRERVDRLQVRFLQLAVKADTVQDRPE